jgi:hypothetical protein
MDFILNHKPKQEKMLYEGYIDEQSVKSLGQYLVVVGMTAYPKPQ